jgi:uncharacterized protein YaaR (DUF327 family)
MRIEQPFRSLGDDEKARLGKNKKIGAKKGAGEVRKDMVHDANFLKELDGAVEDQVKMSLDQLVEEIDQQAKNLANHRTFEELDKYKKLVKNFMKQAVTKIYTVKVSDSSKLMIKRKKVYIMVQQVDKELEKLTVELIAKQAESLDLLSVLEKISGMLVDMYS